MAIAAIQRIGQAVTKQAVITIAAAHILNAGKRVIARRANRVWYASIQINRDRTCGVSIEGPIRSAAAAKNRIIAIAAREGIIDGTTNQRVIARRTIDCIGATIA